MDVRLGQLLINAGLLTEEQVGQIVAAQRTAARPFGLLAEEMFGINPADIEAAWVEQYQHLTRTVDLGVEVFEPQAMALVTRRQAWQFGVLPVRYDRGDLMIATTLSNLRRALRFATKVLGVPAFFVLTDEQGLGEALCHHFRLPGMTPQSLKSDAIRAILDGGAAADRAVA